MLILSYENVTRGLGEEFKNLMIKRDNFNSTRMLSYFPKKIFIYFIIRIQSTRSTIEGTNFSDGIIVRLCYRL